jgi:hypothetical protein
MRAAADRFWVDRRAIGNATFGARRRDGKIIDVGRMGCAGNCESVIAAIATAVGRATEESRMEAAGLRNRTDGGTTGFDADRRHRAMSMAP